MVVVCDLDGVVFNSENIVRCEAELYDILKYNGAGIKKQDKFTTYKCYGWSQAQIQEYEEYIYPDVGFYCDVMPGAKKVLEIIKNLGHNVFAVTKRGYFGQKEIDLTEEKLKKEGIVFDKVIYNQSNKVKTCLDLQAAVVIEDNYEHINSLIKEGIKCIYLRDICQPEILSPYVKEVHNWGEILREIMTMGEK